MTIDGVRYDEHIITICIIRYFSTEIIYNSSTQQLQYVVTNTNHCPLFCSCYDHYLHTPSVTPSSGPGPLAQPLSEALLDPATGLPKPPGPQHKRMKI